jgi:hypothetical protein
VLAPGETQQVQVDLTPPDKNAPYTIRLMCVDDQSGEVLAEASFHGHVVPWLGTPVQTVQLEVLGRDNNGTSQVEVKNLSSRRFSGAVAVDGAAAAFVDVEPSQLVLEPGASGSLTVKGNYPGYRRVRGQLQFADSEIGKAVHQVDLVVTGGSHYVANPPALLWSTGARPEEPMTLGLGRQDGMPFKVVTARLEPQVSWLSVAHGNESLDTHELRLDMDALGKGQTYMGKLIVQTDCRDEPEAMPVRLVATPVSSGS